MSKDAVKTRAIMAFACECEACVRDGLHEPDCAVHEDPPRPCSCGRTDQSQGAS